MPRLVHCRESFLFLTESLPANCAYYWFIILGCFSLSDFIVHSVLLFYDCKKLCFWRKKVKHFPVHLRGLLQVIPHVITDLQMSLQIYKACDNFIWLICGAYTKGLKEIDPLRSLGKCLFGSRDTKLNLFRPSLYHAAKIFEDVHTICLLLCQIQNLFMRIFCLENIIWFTKNISP